MKDRFLQVMNDIKTPKLTQNQEKVIEDCRAAIIGILTAENGKCNFSQFDKAFSNKMKSSIDAMAVLVGCNNYKDFLSKIPGIKVVKNESNETMVEMLCPPKPAYDQKMRNNKIYNCAEKAVEPVEDTKFAIEARTVQAAKSVVPLKAQTSRSNLLTRAIADLSKNNAVKNLTETEISVSYNNSICVLLSWVDSITD